jgi:uncharacterized integral membrane protein
MMKIKVYTGLTLLILVVVFIVQNAEVVNIRLLFWNISMSRSLMIFMVLIIGIVVGWLMAGHFNTKQQAAKDNEKT